jgi:bis(5'-adenosyl)-triphosphatase
MKKSCPFCLNNDSQFYFLKDKNFKAIYNKSPILPGHSLIVPNRHVERFSELTDEELAGLLLFTKKVNELLDHFFPNSGFNWTIQDGAAAGQTMPHLHVHVIPRKEGDLPDPGDWYPLLEQVDNAYLDSSLRPTLSEEQLLEITEKLKTRNV